MYIVQKERKQLYIPTDMAKLSVYEANVCSSYSHHGYEVWVTTVRVRLRIEAAQK